MNEHMVLGIDKRDAEWQKDLWLAHNPAIKVLKVHRATREQHLLTHFGGTHIPRVSITVDYEEPDVGAE